MYATVGSDNAKDTNPLLTHVVLVIPSKYDGSVHTPTWSILPLLDIAKLHGWPFTLTAKEAVPAGQRVQDVALGCAAAPFSQRIHDSDPVRE